MVTYPTGPAQNLSYDFAGRLTYFWDGTQAMGWEYDGMGDLVRYDSVDPATILSYQCDAAGRRTRMELVTDVTSFVSTYAYDDVNHKVTLTNPFSESTVYTYDTSQRLVRRDLASGAYETFAFDNRSRPTSVQLKNSSGAVLSSQSYTYDAASNLLTHTQDGVATTYGYDAIDQILSESRSGYSASYTYDANGNRTTRMVNGLLETYVNDLGDKLTSVSWNGGYKNYGYDACGRMTSVTTPSGVTSLAYDYEDRVTSIAYPNGGGTGAYAYNGFDTRIRRTDRFGQTYTYRRDGGGVTDAVLQDGIADYTPGVSRRQGSTTTFGHGGIKNDSVQSTSSQTVSASRTYDAFGNLSASSGSWNGPFGYGGGFGYQEDSDSGLKLLGTRYYDPGIGRFLSRDKGQFGRNWFAYCKNSPLLWTDPSGLKEIWGFDFNWQTVGNGLMTGLAAVGSSLSGGLWNGGKYRNELGFGESQVICDIGTAPLNRFSGGGVGSVLKYGGRALGIANKAVKAEKTFKWTQNTKWIDSLSGVKRYRVPDILTKHVLGEVKDVRYQALTRQLRDYQAWANANGRKFYLFVREDTRLSSPLQNQVDIGNIILKRRLK